jgi:hypothetical protein
MASQAKKSGLIRRTCDVANSIATAYRRPIVKCRKCSRQIDATAQVASAPTGNGALQLDTRQVLVRCPKCKTFAHVFIYPLFNFIPPTRALAAAVMLTLLSITLVTVVSLH